MIRMLPEGLFLDMAVRIGVIFAAALAILMVIGLAAGKLLPGEEGRRRMSLKDAH